FTPPSHSMLSDVLPSAHPLLALSREPEKSEVFIIGIDRHWASTKIFWDNGLVLIEFTAKNNRKRSPRRVPLGCGSRQSKKPVCVFQAFGAVVLSNRTVLL
ncbi:MAG: hypothetical protein AAGU11_03580, partial [Syntrophobacteraceae bacterium]